jgi:hypothetical protein
MTSSRKVDGGRSVPDDGHPGVGIALPEAPLEEPRVGRIVLDEDEVPRPRQVAVAGSWTGRAETDSDSERASTACMPHLARKIEE